MFIFGIILLVIGIVGLVVAARLKRPKENRYGDVIKGEYDKTTNRIAALSGTLFAIAGILVAGFSTIYFQSEGEARVILNVDRTVASVDTTPGAGFMAPLQSSVDYDLFSQTLQFAGDGNDTPSYTGGTVNGQQVTASVAGGAQSNFDLSITYSIDPDSIREIYTDFRTQERFTQQVIVQKALAVIRKVPAAYTPVEFRGAKSGEAQEKMLAAVQKALKPYGVDVSILNAQSVRFSDDVEASIKAVEVSQQKEEAAKAELRATEVSAQAKVVEAQAQADANAILNANPLSDASVQQKYVDAIGNGKAVFVVPEGSTPLITVQ